MKRNYQIAMNEGIHKSIKVMAAQRGLTIGETIAALVNFSEAGEQRGRVECAVFNEACLSSRVGAMGHGSGGV